MHRLAYSYPIAASLVLGWSGAADAHHSISGVYDGRRQVTITALVREFQFVNPHPRILVQVVEVSGDAGGGEDGSPGMWTLEMDNRWELAELGFDDDTLVPGDRIVVTGSMARRQERSLYVRRLEHPAEDFSYRHHR